MKNSVYYFFLFLLFRNILLLSNGYSNKTTGLMIISNVIFMMIFYFLVIFKTKKYNLYLLLFFFSFSAYFTKFSAYTDLNKRFNKIVICIYLITLLIEIAVLVFLKFRKEQKRLRLMIKVILSLISGVILLDFLVTFYFEPQNVIYSTNISSIKNEKDLLTILDNMPVLEGVYLTTEKKDIGFKYSDKEMGYLYVISQNEKNINMSVDKSLLISLNKDITQESVDRLMIKIETFLEMSKLKDELVRVYITRNKNSAMGVAIYELKNGEKKIIYEDFSYSRNQTALKGIIKLVIGMQKGIIRE